MERGLRAIYLAPLRALAAELGTRWQGRFGQASVGVFAGATGSRPSRPMVPFEEARVLDVMTPERLDACTRTWRAHWPWIPEVDLVVVDELHLLGDPHRGPRLEGTLLRFRRLNPFARLVGLSATLGNREELAAGSTAWSTSGRGGRSPIQWRVVEIPGTPVDRRDEFAG